jgi:tRNA A-37 threonylcarbamoyl transferase component Bud32
MIDKSGRVFIIDYDLAKFVRDEEASDIHEFNESFPDEYEAVGIMSQEGIRYVYDKLVQEGSIKDTVSTVSTASTASNAAAVAKKGGKRKTLRTA